MKPSAKEQNTGRDILSTEPCAVSDGDDSSDPGPDTARRDGDRGQS